MGAHGTMNSYSRVACCETYVLTLYKPVFYIIPATHMQSVHMPALYLYKYRLVGYRYTVCHGTSSLARYVQLVAAGCVGFESCLANARQTRGLETWTHHAQLVCVCGGGCHAYQKC